MVYFHYVSLFNVYGTHIWRKILMHFSLKRWRCNEQVLLASVLVLITLIPACLLCVSNIPSQHMPDKLSHFSRLPRTGILDVLLTQLCETQLLSPIKAEGNWPRFIPACTILPACSTSNQAFSCLQLGRQSRLLNLRSPRQWAAKLLLSGSRSSDVQLLCCIATLWR